ncbi:MAG: hypothetical protein MPK06_02045 [Alphaproteobacteria bacterium]|nr:hypothetical protein [Alphaproteobacteria bacterium]MDA8003357.1 hypothetical protein [Alphaproteobacteria bacterium]MDA8005309.1 hypothetical protein [Alphaproteobacteria bacterium]MDA8012742.1 hypothetical protein [Alphaproteobacteria bacterium]
MPPREDPATKRHTGRYYTKGNPFSLPAFTDWADICDISRKSVLEPFAGSNNLVRMLEDLGLCRHSRSFDIAPGAPEVRRQDSIQNFPKMKDSVVVTNPPWLARNSATRRGLPYPKESQYDDLYKHCLSLCLQNNDYVAAIIPASFLTTKTKLFVDHLHSVTLFSSYFFDDTEHPSCLALFCPVRDQPEPSVYRMRVRVGGLRELRKHLPRSRVNRGRIRFNDPDGVLGLHAIDNTVRRSIQFCEGAALAGYDIGFTSRSITRISVPVDDAAGLAATLNRKLNQFRQKTQDVFLTPFKGLRADGDYRRRLDYRLARAFIEEAI